MNISVFVPDKKLQDDITAAAGEDFAIKNVFADQEELQKAIPVQKIDVLVIDPASLGEATKTLIKETVPYIIVIAASSSVATFKTSLELGAKDLLTVPFKQSEMTEAFRKAQHHIALQHSAQKGTPGKSGKVCVFLSSKGGVGRSVLAINCAVMLQKASGNKVLLIDTVPRFGSSDILIDLNEKKSMGMIPVTLDDYDAYWQEIEDNIITHSSGLHLLVAGEKHEGPIPAQKIRSILTSVKDKYDHIIIDTEPFLNEVNLALLEVADMAFFVSTFDIASVKNLNLGLETIRSLYFSTDKIKIIINQFDKNNELTVAELEKYIKYKITTIIPYDRETVLRSINNGIPFVIENEASEISQGIRALTDCLSGKGCALTVPSSGQNMPGSNWLKNFVHIFGEK